MGGATSTTTLGRVDCGSHFSSRGHGQKPSLFGSDVNTLTFFSEPNRMHFLSKAARPLMICVLPPHMQHSSVMQK